MYLAVPLQSPEFYDEGCPKNVGLIVNFFSEKALRNFYGIPIGIDMKSGFLLTCINTD